MVESFTADVARVLLGKVRPWNNYNGRNEMKKVAINGLGRIGRLVLR